MTLYRFQRDTLLQTPWKNGGGITRKIRKSAKDEPFWRLSIADVDQDGPFSLFPNMHRILTVIEGKGMRLIGPKQDYLAQKWSPVNFSGEESIQGDLLDGPIQDFNLIYDIASWQAEVIIGQTDCLIDHVKNPSNMQALYCLEGQLCFKNDEPLARYDGLIIEAETYSIEFTDESTGTGLLINLKKRI